MAEARFHHISKFSLKTDFKMPNRMGACEEGHDSKVGDPGYVVSEDMLVEAAPYTRRAKFVPGQID